MLFLFWHLRQRCLPAIVPALSRSLRTRGAKGCQIFAFIRGNYPERIIKSGLKKDGKAVAEWRGGLGYSVIFGIHPDTGSAYQRVVDQPAIVVNWSDLNWPAHWRMPLTLAPDMMRARERARSEQVVIGLVLCDLFRRSIQRLTRSSPGGSHPTSRLYLKR